MKRSIITGILTVVMTLSLHAMEIEQTGPSKSNDYGSFVKKKLNVVRGQMRAWYESIQQMQTHRDLSLFSLQDIKKELCAMFDDDKKEIIKNMSTQLLMLSCIATYLPEDVVKDHICLFMLDGCRQEAETFYKTPLIEHFELYHNFKTRLADDTKPIGPLYAASQGERDLILGLQQPWYCALPVMCLDRKKMLDEMRDELKQIYTLGKKISVIPDDLNRLKLNVLISIVPGLLIFGLMASGERELCLVTLVLFSCFGIVGSLSSLLSLTVGAEPSWEVKQMTL